MWNTWNRWTWSGAHTKAYTKLPRHFLFDCGVLETPQILGLEHKSKDKLQRVFSGNRGNSAPIRVGCCARYAPGQFFKEHHDGRFRWEQSICSQWKLPRELSDVERIVCWMLRPDHCVHLLEWHSARFSLPSQVHGESPCFPRIIEVVLAVPTDSWSMIQWWWLCVDVLKCFFKIDILDIFLYCNWAKFVSMTQAWRRWWDIFQGAQHEGHWHLQHPFSRGLSRAVFCVSWTSELDCQCARLQF